MKKIVLFIAIMSIYTGTKAAYGQGKFDDFDYEELINQLCQDDTLLSLARESSELFPGFGFDPNKNFDDFLRENRSQVTLIQNVFGVSVKKDLLTIFNRILTSYPVFLNVKDTAGNTFLHFAAIFGSLKIMEALIQRGMHVNTINNLGDTPLHIAAYRNNIQAVQLLLNYGADSTIKNNAGNTAFDVAKDPEIRALLIESAQATNSKRSCSPDAETSSSKRRH